MPQRFRNAVLLLSSILFYSWGAPKFIFVILGTTIVDFLLVGQMDKSTNERSRKLFLITSVSINLGLLFYFKYLNFFLDNINVLAGWLGFNGVHYAKLLLPIGISFYTFETITYVVDVYRKVHKPQTNFWNYQLYIIFFPKLIAGPIIRYHDFADQISNRFFSDTYYNRLAGFTRFSIGLGKKILIANVLGAYADEIFGYDYSSMDNGTAWLGILSYTFQIYFDFSGYSDMALGLARMMGFSLPENFNSPYTSKSITEFWRRWHISLGNWMKNYLYIPLGGNKVNSTARLYLNLVLVFLASGFWHGASWNFIFWGCFHGLFLVLERAGLSKFYTKLPNVITILINFIVVAVGWVYFRIEHFADASLYVSRMFNFSNFNPIEISKEQVFYLCIATFFAFFTAFKVGKKFENYFYFSNDENRSSAPLMVVISICLLVLSVSSIASVGFNPFIYFRF
jgi:alginate O-acetyltransferase complex protein AlgI